MEHDNALIIFGYSFPAFIVTAFIILVILLILSLILTRNLSVEKTSKKQVMAESFVDSILGFMEPILGSREKAEKYLPIIGSVFILILFSNYSGLIPGVGIYRGLQAPTSSFVFNFCISVSVFLLSIYYGIRERGVHYFKHFILPYFFILPLNILDELIKPLSLSLRLFGSVYAEEIILVCMYQIFPYGAPIFAYFLSLFFGLLQAYVFALLTTIYFASATQHEN